MNRALKVFFAAVIVLFALTFHSAEATCKSKLGKEDNSGSDVDVPQNKTSNKIQDAPRKRLNNKIAFDVVPKEQDDSSQTD
ncbi:hypothetical protein Poli38472_012810 [Pythium oligandrum]|uniref:Uncharacterized protein n=1 Tax=Pythium oligandrum TaxID=41045 RepID=A0A8K1CJQ3_PYTOL|nr:hypothetical protein Poli38472_012810 [Pythium oligandrum]|eukprot:TMW64188.1 hypothetical protein Poli38472_012810 [Pythium oligandrum]